MILVGGEALVDIVVRSGEPPILRLGGGPFNVARSAARLGATVGFVGRLSTDLLGSQLHDQLAGDGVDVALVTRCERPTTLALAEVDALGVATYHFYTEGTAAPELSLADVQWPPPSPVDAFHFGTLGLVFEPMAETLLQLAARCAPTALVMVDLNCRPQAVTDRSEYQRRVKAALRLAHVVKVSQEDLAYLGSLDPEWSEPRGLLAGGADLVLATLGAAGARVVGASMELEVVSPAVEVVDTIGAGDAFGGAFVGWWVAHGLGVDETSDAARVRSAVEFACLVASLTCTRAGASPPTLTEIGIEASLRD